MKYVVNVADKDYEVEIVDIFARPVIARVDGREFQVSPEGGIGPTIRKENMELKPVAIPRQPSNSGLDVNELTAPLPGTVIEVFVKPRDQIQTGHIILIIEAMKMKNSIRATRSGTVSEVLVSAGQTVAHRQALVKFAE
jgi:glutaconyl-CoA/methylmalonyl-CoA decarboxylase subunit gamma